MAGEIAEIPAATESLICRSDFIQEIAARVSEFKPRTVVFCGRGSSGHAGTYLRYLVETRLGVIVSFAAPSVTTSYRARQDMRDVLFVVISQSGQSPDLSLSAEAARAQGALTLAIVNETESPVASACERVIGIHTGPERAIAATKTVVLSMLAGAALIGTMAQDRELLAGLRRLPERLSAALALDWSPWAAAVAHASASFVAGRGYALGPVREIALKTTEVLRMPSLGFSAAELRHGPRAAISHDTPVLLLRQMDDTADATGRLAHELREAGGCVFTAGGADCSLSWIDDDHPALDPVLMLLPAYLAVEAAARARGLDPDRSPYLSKVTQTF